MKAVNAFDNWAQRNGMNSDKDAPEPLKLSFRRPLEILAMEFGRAGSAKAVGYERQEFGRNSKVLQGYVRSVVNIAPEKSDSNETLIVASGKSNNSEEFQPFGIRLDPKTMTYQRDDSIDIAAWRELVGAGSKTAEPLVTIGTVVEVVAGAGLNGIEKSKLVASVMKDSGCKRTHAYNLVNKAESKKAIVRRKGDELYVVPTR